MRLLALLALLVAWPLASQAGADPALRVLVTGDAPFVTVQPDHTFDGISVRLWKAVALQANLDFDWVGNAAMHEGLVAVSEGRADVLVGPVGITAARARLVSFSQPYYFASQGLASLEQPTTRWDFIYDYLVAGATLLGSVLGLLVAIGFVVWLLERRRNPHFPRSFGPGLASGMWLAVVTMTTVGYGDHVPITRLGRTFAAAMMVTGMLFASTLTATLTSVMAEYGARHRVLDSPDELSGRRLASVASSTSSLYARRWSRDVTLVTDLDRAMSLLQLGQVDAVVYHYPETLHWCHQNPEARIHLASVDSAVSQYGFGFPPGSPIVRQVNLAILDLMEQGEVDRIEAGWMADVVPPH